MVKANTNRTIKAILQKKYWDGRDTGRILLYNLARARDQQKKGKEPKPAYPTEEFNIRVNNLFLHERLHYRMYEALNDLIPRFVASFGLYRMNLYYDFLLYQRQIETLQATDEAKQDAADAPLIMTQEQYDREHAQARREYKAGTINYFELVMLEVKRAMKKKEDGILFDMVLDELEPLRNEKATDKVMLAQYNRIMDRGYYVIPATGLRSDQTNAKTWDAAVEEIISRLAARVLKLEMGMRSVPDKQGNALGMIAKRRRYRGLEYLYNGGEAILIALRENIQGRKDTDYKGRPLTAAELEYITAKIIDTLPVQAIIIAAPGTEKFKTADKHLVEDVTNLIMFGGSAPVWHYYDDVPDNVNKYDILVKGIDLYATDEGNYFYGSEEGRANAFKAEFPELYEAALRVVETEMAMFPGSTKDPLKSTVRVGTLIRTRRIKEDLQELIDARTPERLKELERRGVAIMHEDWIKPEDVDKRGNYKPHMSIFKEWRELLRKLENGEEDAPRDILKQNVLPDATGYFTYNQMIDIIAEVTDVPLLTVFKSDTDELMEAAKEVNQKIYSLVYKTYVGTQSDAAKREEFRQQVKKAFKPINLYQYYAKQKEIEPIRHELEQLITPPHIYKGNRVLPVATIGHLKYAIWEMLKKLQNSVESRCKGE